MEQTFDICADICDPEWSYFNGYCYFTSQKCTNWTTALSKCRQENSVLVDVNNNEENVFIQNRHNGEKSWLGYNDRSTEGDFIWLDRGPANFAAWAENQPNNVREENCVHALGEKYSYEWNDVKCSDCHRYTCKKGKLYVSYFLLIRIKKSNEQNKNVWIHYVPTAFFVSPKLPPHLYCYNYNLSESTEMFSISKKTNKESSLYEKRLIKFNALRGRVL